MGSPGSTSMGLEIDILFKDKRAALNPTPLLKL